MSSLSVLASLDLKRVPVEVLHAMMIEIEKEIARRRYVAVKDRIVYKKVRQRLKTAPNNGRSEEDLYIKDWENLYQIDIDGPKTFYVYAHVRPDDGFIEIKTAEDQWVGLRISGMPFYIGKGTGGRAYDLNRNQGHGAEIRQLLKEGYSQNEIVCIVADGLTERQALMIESKLIYILGTRYERNTQGILVNLDIPAIPKILEKKR